MYHYYPTRQPVMVRDSDLRIDRHLPVTGEVKVRIGDRVEANTLVATGDRTGRAVPINVARELAVEPDQAGERLVKAPGQEIGADEPIAKRRRGLRVQTVKSPVAGTFVRFDAATGVATIRPATSRIELMASVAGVVEGQEQMRGVTIRVFGSRFYGIFGVGAEAFGVLKVVGKDRQRPLGPELIDGKAARAIVAAGGMVNAAALNKAVQVGAKGVIAGSIEESELLQFLKVPGSAFWQVGLPDWRLPSAAPLTLVLTEGLGRLAMAAPLYDALVAGDGGQVTISGITQLAGGLRRPEVILSGRSGQAGDDAGLPVAELVPGATVRVVDQDHLGLVAQVVEAPRRRRLAQDLLVDALEVRLPNGDHLTVPTANVEILA